MSVLCKLDESEQKAAWMKAAGMSLKEIAAETGLSYERTRHIFAENSKQRNEDIIAAVAEIRQGLAQKLKGIEEDISSRLRAEIQHGDPEFAHKYISLAMGFLKENNVEEEAPKSMKIKNLIQNVFKT